VNGGLVRLAPSSVGGADLLDMNFATAGSFDDAQLDVGKSFTDPELSLTITALSKTTSSAGSNRRQVTAGPTPAYRRQSSSSRTLRNRSTASQSSAKRV